ncbi:MAG: metallopeptidase [Clostridia bacterium]|nr:metallopeptidase [Clostridia bacterium]
MRFMDVALNKLEPVPYEGTLATDGEKLYFDPVFVLRGYMAEQTRPARDHLHVILHCLFRHMFVSPAIDREFWDLACDMAAEAVIEDLDLRSVETAAAPERGRELERLKAAGVPLTAEKLFRHFSSDPPDPARLAALRRLFAADDHAVWYAPPQGGQSASGGERNESGDGQSDNGSSGGESGSSGQDEGNGGGSSASFAAAREKLEQEWRDASERVRQDLETFSKERGDAAGDMMQNLREVNREKYDYTAFLKQFAVLGEVMKINDDEFDYIFYTYGLKLYKKVPLIEPLEYKEAKRIREFVIAIDTSGSVQGEEVQSFLQKTYNILKSTESFFSKINLHIIQCDADVQEHVKITSQEEFDRYLERLTIKGLGGTDFRPVFALVDELIRNKEFTDLKGMIYFTDGFGTFPERMPPYKAAFVFVNDDPAAVPPVPPWAIKLILPKDDLLKEN